MYSLTTMHQMNNPDLYALTEEDKQAAHEDPLFAEWMTVALHLKKEAEPWDRVVVRKIRAYANKIKEERQLEEARERKAKQDEEARLRKLKAASFGYWSDEIAKEAAETSRRAQAGWRMHALSREFPEYFF